MLEDVSRVPSVTHDLTAVFSLQLDLCVSLLTLEVVV